MSASSSSLSSSIFEDGYSSCKDSGDGDRKSPGLQNPLSCFVAGSVSSRACSGYFSIVDSSIALLLLSVLSLFRELLCVEQGIGSTKRLDFYVLPRVGG
jgi:hypothetical protein